MQPSPAATRLVRDLARAALCIENERWPDSIELLDLDSGDIIAAIRRHRLVELIAGNAEKLGLPDEISSDLADLNGAARRGLMLQLLELTRIRSMFQQVGVPWLSIKGPALSVQSAGSLTARGFGDLDVFVHPESVEAVNDALNDNGWIGRPVGLTPHDSWARRHLMSTQNEITFDGPASEIDLHWRLDPTHDALPDFATCWSRRTSVECGEISVDTLCIADAFKHSCYNAMKDDWRSLRSLVDIHRLARLIEITDATTLSRTEKAALQVTHACVGLPDRILAVADLNRDAIASHPASAMRRPVRRARKAQQRPLVEAYPVPGSQPLHRARYRVDASHTAGDLRRTAFAVVFTGTAMLDLPDRSGWTAVPRVLVRRGRWLIHRMFAWARHEPGAGTQPPPLKSR